MVDSCTIVLVVASPLGGSQIHGRGANNCWDYGTIGFGILWDSMKLFGIILGITNKFA